MVLYRATARETELLADAFRKRLPDSGPPIPIERYAEVAGITEILYDDITASAFLVASTDDPDTCSLVLNRRDSRTRHRFSIAHEMGHRVVHPDRRAHQFGERIAARSRRRDPVESSCDHFAACLLMPRAWVNEHEVYASSLRGIAKRFEVSEAAMRSRLRELGLNRLAYP